MKIIIHTRGGFVSIESDAGALHIKHPTYEVYHRRADNSVIAGPLYLTADELATRLVADPTTPRT